MWNDDDRSLSPMLKSGAVPKSEDKHEHFVITDILKELIQEERERMYDASPVISDHNKPKPSYKSANRFTYKYVDESDDNNDYSSDDEDATTITKDANDQEDEVEECTSAPQTDTMTRIIEDQIYRRFGYV